MSHAPATSPIPSSPSSADRPLGGATRLATTGDGFRRRDAEAVDWAVAEELVSYEDAVGVMERRADAIARGDAPEAVWLVEHPALLTVGTATVALPTSPRFPVHRSGRGGQITYHGPGQRVAYVMLDLKARRADVRAFVAALEQWIIATLASFAVAGERREDRVGVWVARPGRSIGPEGTVTEDKIAAIGIRLRRWVSFHGIALNVAPDLSHYAGIVPCGIADAHLGVTSLADLGLSISMAEADAALHQAFTTIFGSTRDV